MTTLLDAPSLLAVLAAVLCAVAMFAPARAPKPAPVSFAPAFPAEPPVERWSPPPLDDEPLFAEDANGEPWEDGPAAPPDPSWPLLIDASAFACDAAARCDLAEALAALRAPWADAILERARAEDSDDGVRAVLDGVIEARARGAVTSP